MMMDWESYRKELLATIQQIGQAGPDIVRGYRAIADGAAKIGKLDSADRFPDRVSDRCRAVAWSRL